ncbi:MAG: type V CRISPR-associated protein Cas12a/Cpf1, partial [Kiritimatiellia bacterium]
TKPKSEDAEDSKTLEKITIVKNWEKERAKKLFDEICTTQAEAKKVLNNVKSEDLDLRKNKEAVATIKAFLDAVQDLLHFIKPLHVSAELERNLSFYEDFDPLYDTLDSIVPLYNRVRNYMTQKAAEEKKIKLMFDSPSLANGWDLNKEPENKCVLLQRDNFYFLGIVNPKQKVDFGKFETTKKIPCYQKMVYKLLPGPNKMLPKVFFAECNKVRFNPPAKLLEKYSAGMYKKGDTFDLAFCHELIDFFKDCINKHEDWSKFDFKFSKTSTYTGIDGFYREVADQGYKLTSVNIPVETIDALVEKGSLSLFKIYNKDFAPGAKGMPNMHTLYWKALFATENLKDVVLKLNGEAELFYRPAGNKTQDKIFSHKVGEKMVNRRDTEGNSIAEDVHGELFDYVNGKKKKADLTQEAQRLIDEKRIIVKDVTHEIIKDRRFTEEKFLFHVPITLNFKAPDKPTKFNDQVADYLRNNPKVNIIGIDRGERNLLYLTLINQKGEIIQQKSFNEVDQLRSDGKTFPVNYHQKLDQAESARDKARKSWDTIGKIKDLKSGYLSQVVHEITTLMIENNAIIVLEDLNFGFKRGRFRIEKQVYQKFEKALIDKLNYLVFKKTNDMNAAGGVLKGYQLTDKFVSFEQLRKQTGFLFYIPAAYTSIIDPTTAFSNLFNIGKYTNAKNCKTFFETFKSICYEKKRDAFAFDFDYKDFKQRLIPKRSKWTVYSAEKRLVFDPEMGGEKTTSPTQIIKDALLEQNVTLKDGFDLLAYIKTLESSKATAFLKKLHNAFKITLQMRNSRKETNEDYIQSPVLNSAGAFFDSRTAAATLPQDADANGAYHIALKGLYLLRNAFKKDKPELKITHEAWFEFAQDFAKAKFTN